MYIRNHESPKFATFVKLSLESNVMLLIKLKKTFSNGGDS